MADYTLRLSFNANGGSGAPSTVIQTVSSTAASVTVTATIPSTRPTRYGYTFTGWSGNGGTYQPSASVSKTFTRQFDDQGNIIDQSATIYFTAAWYVQSSTWGTTPSSVQLNGSTSYTFNINKAGAVDHHTVKFTLGSESLTYTNVGTSKSVTFPTSWQSQLPNATSGSITCTLTSYNSGGSKLGSTSKTITGNVPSSVVPTISVTHQTINSNSTVAGWGILLQGYSQIKFTATAAGAGGSTISAITFSGAGLSQSSTSTTATSSVLAVSGSQTWTVTVRDSRGRTASTTYTETVYDYSPPSISTASAKRCDSGGTINEATGTYAKFNGTYAYSTANGHNATTQRVDSKLHSSSTWTTRANSYTSGTNVVIGGGSFDVDKTYDIRLTITDSLGNTATYSVFLASVQGFALGLKNDRARFGGVVQQAGLEVDWDAQFDGVVDIVNRRSYATLSSAGWYRVCKFDFSTYGEAIGAAGGILHLNITDSYGTNANDSHTIDLLFAHNKITFANESSVGNHLGVDKIRYTLNSASPYDGFVDIHWVGGSSYIGVTFDYDSIALIRQANLTSSNLIAVAPAPSGETVMSTYTFAADTLGPSIGQYSETITSFSTVPGLGNYYHAFINIESNINIKPRNVLAVFTDWGAGSNSVTGFTVHGNQHLYVSFVNNTACTVYITYLK